MRARRVVPLAAWTAAALAAGCSGSGTAAARTLTPADVQGSYRPCVLRFTPSAGGLPPADLLRAVVDTSAAAPVPARLVLSGTAPEFALTYARRGDGAVQHAEGDAEFGGGSVFLFLGSRVPTSITTEALLPPFHLDLVYAAADRRLSAGAEVGAYPVRRSDYARAAGVDEAGLQDRIYGHVTASFSAGGC